MNTSPPHTRSQEWSIEVVDRGDGAFVATISRLGQMMCRITRSSTSEQVACTEARRYAEGWINEYVARRSDLETKRRTMA